MPTKKQQSDDGGIPLSVGGDSVAERHPDGVPVQVPESPPAVNAGQKATTQKEK